MDQEGLDGIYSDEFSWAGLTRGYSRYDYSRSDGYSADLDEDGGVVRLKSDNAMVTEAAQSAITGECLRRGKFFLGNGGTALRSINDLPIQRFVEGGNGPAYWGQGHLSAVPLVLGNMGDDEDGRGRLREREDLLALWVHLLTGSGEPAPRGRRQLRLQAVPADRRGDRAGVGHRQGAHHHHGDAILRLGRQGRQGEGLPLQRLGHAD